MENGKYSTGNYFTFYSVLTNVRLKSKEIIDGQKVVYSQTEQLTEHIEVIIGGENQNKKLDQQRGKLKRDSMANK